MKTFVLGSHGSMLASPCTLKNIDLSIYLGKQSITKLVDTDNHHNSYVREKGWIS